MAGVVTAVTQPTMTRRNYSLMAIFDSRKETFARAILPSFKTSYEVVGKFHP